jgi:hypothetical protein
MFAAQFEFYDVDFIVRLQHGKVGVPEANQKFLKRLAL